MAATIAANTREAVVCAACPAEHADEVALLCRQRKVMKAFQVGLPSSMAQWETQVSMAVVGLVEEREARSARVVAVEGGPGSDLQMATTQHLVQVIRASLGDATFPVQVQWMSMGDFRKDDSTECVGNKDSNVLSKGAGKGRGKVSMPVGTFARGSRSAGPATRYGNLDQQPTTKGASKGEPWRVANSRQRCQSSRPRNQSMQPRRQMVQQESLAVAWACPECQLVFEKHEELVDHQQSAGHWAPTLENCGRVFIGENDLKARLASNMAASAATEEFTVVSPGPACHIHNLDADDVNDSNQDHDCKVFNMSSPKDSQQHPKASEKNAGQTSGCQQFSLASPSNADQQSSRSKFQPDAASVAQRALQTPPPSGAPTTAYTPPVITGPPVERRLLTTVSGYARRGSGRSPGAARRSSGAHNKSTSLADLTSWRQPAPIGAAPGPPVQQLPKPAWAASKGGGRARSPIGSVQSGGSRIHARSSRGQ